MTNFEKLMNTQNVHKSISFSVYSLIFFVYVCYGSFFSSFTFCHGRIMWREKNVIKISIKMKFVKFQCKYGNRWLLENAVRALITPTFFALTVTEVNE